MSYIYKRLKKCVWIRNSLSQYISKIYKLYTLWEIELAFTLTFIRLYATDLVGNHTLNKFYSHNKLKIILLSLYKNIVFASCYGALYINWNGLNLHCINNSCNQSSIPSIINNSIHLQWFHSNTYDWYALNFVLFDYMIGYYTFTSQYHINKGLNPMFNDSFFYKIKIAIRIHFSTWNKSKFIK